MHENAAICPASDRDEVEQNTTFIEAAAAEDFDESNVEPKHDHLKLDVAFTTGRTDTAFKSVSTSWENLRKVFEKPTATVDRSLSEYRSMSPSDRAQLKDGYAMVPVKFKDASLGRKTENILHVSMIVLDIDHGMSLEDAALVLQGTESLIHTTFSHTPANPHLRVVIPLAEPVSREAASTIFDHMQKLFAGHLDSACLEPARLFYLPRCLKETEEHYRQLHIPGELFCLNATITKSLAKALSGAMDRHQRTEEGGAVTASHVPVGKRNMTLASEVGRWANDGLSESEIVHKAHQWNSALINPLGGQEVEQVVRSIMKTASRKDAALAASVAQSVEEMNKKYVFLTDTGQVFRLADRKVVSMEQMRNTYANQPVSDDSHGGRRITVFDAWLKSLARYQLRNITLAPGEGPVVNQCLNLWDGWGVEPNPGDVTPWCELLDHIFGAETPERIYFEQWAAYPIQYPGTKLMTAALVWSSRQGIGKSLLGETIGLLYGKHATTIGAQELHSAFNEWAKGKLFVIGEENSGSDRRADANRLKHLITGSTIYINQKNVPQFEQPNFMNLMFTSNHPDAFHLDVNDRRMFVHEAKVAPLASDFYRRYGKWMKSESGLAALMDHLLHVDLSGFDPHESAPQTASRAAMIDMSRTEVERFVAEATSGESLKHRGCEVVELEKLVREFNNRTTGQRSNTTAMAKALYRHAPYTKRRVSIDGERVMLVSLANRDHWEQASNEEWALEYDRGALAKIERDMEL